MLDEVSYVDVIKNTLMVSCYVFIKEESFWPKFYFNALFSFDLCLCFLYSLWVSSLTLESRESVIIMQPLRKCLC